MADAALSLLRDPELWGRFSRDAWRRAEQEFPEDRMVERYRAIYERRSGLPQNPKSKI
jgi:glycosyltransferase involved in cell wall biosynthesis